MQRSPLIIKFDDTGNHGYVWSTFTVEYDGNLLSVPPGFKTDFASIPQAIRNLIPQLGRWTAGAVAHDYAYWCGESLGFDQKKADKMFNTLMKDAGVKAWRRNAIYYALRLGGWVAWKNHRKDGHCFDNAV